MESDFGRICFVDVTRNMVDARRCHAHVVGLQVQARLNGCLTVFAGLGRRLLILFLEIIAIDLYVLGCVYVCNVLRPCYRC